MRSNRTIQGMIDQGFHATACCHNPRCAHRADLDWLLLRDKLGPDHGALHDDIAPKLKCSKCGGRKVGLILSPKGNDKLGLDNAHKYGNAYQRAKDGR